MMGAAFEDAGNTHLLSRLGHLAYELERYDQAIDVWRLLLKHAPDHTVTLHSLAVTIKKELGGLAEAHDLLERAVSLESDFANARLSLAGCLHHLGEIDAAREHAEWVKSKGGELADIASKFLQTLDAQDYRWSIVTKQA